nr:hypothetical protein [Tanacetum cinerariifolium]
MRRVRKGFSGVETPLFETMLAVRDIAEEAEVQVSAQDDDVHKHVAEEVAADVIQPTPLPHYHHLMVEGMENANAAQQLEIVTLKARVKKLEKLNKVKSSKLRRLRKDKGIELVVDQEKDDKIKGRQADKQAEIYNIDLDHSSKVIAASTPIPAAKPKSLKIAAALAVLSRRRKGVVIRDPEEELHTYTPAETTTVKDKGKGILIEDSKPMKKKD